MAEFFLELFSEEIPAGLQKNLRVKLLEEFQKFGKFYANGKLLKASWQGDFTRIPSGEEVLRSSFVIGQEPDRFNGGW